jgi:glycosyltransferase involved in cell wall biosynthesis
MSPLVSIIVPTFNRLKFLRPTIESVFKQTCQDWELLLADDGSDAATRAYLQSIEAPPRVRVLWLAHSGKPAVARNAAMREARGEYIAFLDSDDLWLPDKLQVQLESLRRHPACQWSHTRFVLVDEAHEPIPWMRGGGWPVPAGWILEEVLESRTVISVPSVIVRRSLLEQVGGFDEELVMCEDFDLWLRLAALSEVDALEQPLTLVLRHAEHSGNELVAFRDCQRVIEKMQRAGQTPHIERILRAERAQLAARVARSHAFRGDRMLAARALISSIRYSWRYRRWWSGALQTLGRILLPPVALNLVRTMRSRRHLQHSRQA